MSLVATRHPAYRAVVGLGPAALPGIMDVIRSGDAEGSFDSWLASPWDALSALRCIAGRVMDDMGYAVPPDMAGKLVPIRDHLSEWWDENGEALMQRVYPSRGALR
jgi:hypothetical protein